MDPTSDTPETSGTLRGSGGPHGAVASFPAAAPHLMFGPTAAVPKRKLRGVADRTHPTTGAGPQCRDTPGRGLVFLE